MSVWRTPSHRDPDKPQIEYCDLCGAPQAAEDLVEATAQDLAGYRVCKEHGDLAFNPSYQDLGGAGNSMPPDPKPLPHSGGARPTYTYTVTYLAFGIPTSPNYSYLFSSDFDQTTFPVRAGDEMTVTETVLGTDVSTVTSVTVNQGEIYIFSSNPSLAGTWMNSPTLSFRRPSILDETEWP